MTETLNPVGNGGSSAVLSDPAGRIFRELWVSLFYSGRVVGKTVMICSARPREGASTIACGLALAGAAPSGVARVALLDFNLRSPSLHEMLPVVQSPGIGEIILEGLAPESAAQRVSEGLDVYSVGNAGERFFEILRAEGLSEFIETLIGGYDHVIIDTSAVNHHPDAQILAGIAKNAVLVSHSERTPREAVAQAKKRIEAGGGSLAGLVLNLRTYPIPKFLYSRV